METGIRFPDRESFLHKTNKKLALNKLKSSLGCNRQQGKLSSISARVLEHISVSIVVSIPVCHTGDRGSIPQQSVIFA